jgi:hypothetical protein
MKYSKKDNMSKVVISYIFPRQLGLTNAFTSKEVLSPNALYHIYMDRNKKLDVSILIRIFSLAIIF